MKPLIMKTQLSHHISSNRIEPELLHELMFANDAHDSLTEVLAKYRARYPAIMMFELEKHDGSTNAYGTGPNGECFSASPIDPMEQPHAFLEAMKDLQYELGNALEEKIVAWGEAYPSDAVRVLDVLDAKVGSVFVDDVWALENLRPIASAYRQTAMEKTDLENSVQVSGTRRLPKSL